MDDIYGRIPHMRSLGPNEEEERKMVYVCSNCDCGIYEGDNFIDEDLILCEECTKNLSAEDAFKMLGIEYSVAEKDLERRY